MHPEILVAGMPNSGTSFMTELVSCTGFSPGPMRDLKMRKDRHNRYGYWEYEPLRNYIWQHTGGCFSERKIPQAPLPFRETPIVSMAKAANVQVFKCFKLPWMYSWFGEPRKAVLIKRSPNTLYRNYYQRAGWEPNEFRAVHTRYYDLAAKYLDSAWDVLWIEYEGFADNLMASVVAVCEFLGRPFTPELLDVWRPRCS